VNLLLLVLVTTFVASVVRADRGVLRAVPLVGLCVIVAIGYLSQRVI
jgi:hypothetical protein